MGDISTKGRTAWRLYQTDGVPASGANHPDKNEIFQFVDAIEAEFGTFSGTGTEGRLIRLGDNAMPDPATDLSEPLHKGFGTIAIGNDILISPDNRTTYSVAIGHNTAMNLVDGYCVTLVGLRNGHQLNAPAYVEAIGCDNLLNALTASNSAALGSKNGLYKTDVQGTVLMGSACYCGGVVRDSVIIGYGAADGDQTSDVYNQEQCVIIGRAAGRKINAPYNVAIGNAALSLGVVTGSYNTSCARSGLTSLTSGQLNSAVGDAAGGTVTTGNNNTFVGALSDVAVAGAGYSNVTCIGASTTVTGGNQVQLGNSATTTYAYGAVQNRSDARDKADVKPTTLGLDFVNAIQWVEFRWDLRDDYTIRTMEDGKVVETSTEPDGSKKRTRFHQGVIGQQVKEVMDALGVDFAGYQDHNINGGQDVISIGYNEFIAPLGRAVQELLARIENLEGQIATLTAARR